MAEPIFGYTPTTSIAVDRSAEAAIKREASVQKQPFDFLGIMRTGAQVAGQFAAEKNQADAHAAYMESLQFTTEIDHLSGHEKVAAIESKIREQAGDNFSSGYRQGSLVVLDKAYNSALKEQEEERVATALNIAETTWIANMAGGYTDWEDAPSFTADFASRNGIHPGQVRDAVHEGTYRHFSLMAMNAKDYDELTSITAEYQNAVAKNFDNVYFEASKAKDFNVRVNQAKTNLDNVVTAKHKQFKLDARAALEAAGKNDITPLLSYSEPLGAVNKTMKIAYPNIDEYTKQAKEWNKNYNLYQEARTEMSGWDPTQPIDKLYRMKQNKPWEDAVTANVESTLIQTFNSGLANSFVATGRVNGMYGTKAGTEIYNKIFSSTDPISFVSNLNTIKAIAGNSNDGMYSMNQVFGPEESKDLITLAILSGKYEDPFEAKKVMLESKSTVGDYYIPKEVERNLDKLRKKYGPMYGDFLAVFKSVDKVTRAGMGTLKEVDAMFESSLTKVGDYKTYNRFGTVDTGVDADKFSEVLSTQLTDANIPNLDQYNLEVHPDNTILLKHKTLGNTPIVVDGNTIKKEAERQLVYDVDEGRTVAEEYLRAKAEETISGISKGLDLFNYNSYQKILEERRAKGEFILPSPLEVLNSFVVNGTAFLKKAFDPGMLQAEQLELYRQAQAAEVEGKYSKANPPKDSDIQTIVQAKLQSREAKTVRNVRNNNPGNIKLEPGTRWDGQINTGDDTFVTFETPDKGVRALGILLQNYQDVHGIKTVKGIINRFAPPSENPAHDSYVNFVAKKLGVKPTEPIKVADHLDNLIGSIIYFEGGQGAYNYFSPYIGNE